MLGECPSEIIPEKGAEILRRQSKLRCNRRQRERFGEMLTEVADDLLELLRLIVRARAHLMADQSARTARTRPRCRAARLSRQADSRGACTCHARTICASSVRISFCPGSPARMQVPNRSRPSASGASSANSLWSARENCRKSAANTNERNWFSRPAARISCNSSPAAKNTSPCVP